MELKKNFENISRDYNAEPETVRNEHLTKSCCTWVFKFRLHSIENETAGMGCNSEETKVREMS